MRRVTQYVFDDIAERNLFGPFGTGVQDGDTGTVQSDFGDYVWDASSGLWRPSSALQLIDKVEVSVSAAQVTLGGLDPALDGAYLVTGKVITEPAGSFGAYELRPVTGSPLTGIASDMRLNATSGSPFSSTTGWTVGIQLLSEPISSGVAWFQAWVWPQKAKFGASGDLAEARLYRSTGMQWRNATDELIQVDCYGRWLDAAELSFGSMTLTGVGGTIGVGSELAIYRLSQG